MALHGKILKHNILRVCKLKKLSHATQSIDRNFDSNATIKNSDVNFIASEKSRSGIWSLPILKSDLQAERERSSSLPFGIEELLALPAHQLPALCWGERFSLSSSPLTSPPYTKTQQAKSTLTTTPVSLQHDVASLSGKTWGYTTDDIVCSTNCNSDLTDCVISYANHRVTLLADSYIRNALELDTSVKMGAGTSDSHHSERPQLRRHSVSESNPAFCDVDVVAESSLHRSPSSSSENIVLCSSGSDKSETGDKGNQGANPDRLKAVEQYFIDTLPQFFKSRQDYRMCHPDIVFENNFFGENAVSVGINQYAVQLMKLRTMTHLKFAHVHMEVVSSNCIFDESKVRIQWRIVGLSQLKALRFWKYTAWGYGKAFKEDAEWLDGISMLYVNKDGLITKHRLDRMTPDEEQTVKAPSLAAKLALSLGLAVPKPGWSDVNSLLFKR